MLEKVERLIQKMREASELIRNFSGEVRLVSHYDCDGICSGAIMAKALVREGRRFRLSFARQLNSDVVSGLSKEGYRLIIFTDLGSGQLGAIQSMLLKDGAKAVILDHHQPQGEVLTDRLLHINTYAMGIGENISGSGISYILARTMNPDNKDLSELGVIGAMGDSQTDSIGSDWGLFGLNKEIMKDAVSAGKVSVGRGLRIWGRMSRPIHRALELSTDPFIPGVSGSESGAVHFLQELGISIRKGDGWRTLSDLSEDEARMLASGIIKERVRGDHENPDWVFGDVYTLLGRGEYSDAGEFATLVNAAGKQGMGYLGLDLCLGGNGANEEMRHVLESHRREIRKAMEAISSGKAGMRSTGSASYIVAGSAIPESVISNVTSMLSRSGRVPEAPLFSLVDADSNWTKVSARLPDSMSGKLNLKELVEEAARSVGGEGGGHSGAAGALIPRGAEEAFINKVETILTGFNKGASDGGKSGGGKAGEPARPAAGIQKMEGKGLVRYIGA